MGYLCIYNNELEILRHTYYYETVCSNLDASTILEMISTNSEMANIKDFSKWLFNDSGDCNQLENLRKWLIDIGHQDYFNKMFDEKYK